MVLPGVVKDHPMISLLGVVLLFGGLAVLAANIDVVGTAVGTPSDECGTWEPAVNPESETEELFESKNAFRSYFEENDAVMPNGSELRYSNGELQFKAPCGTVGGDTSS